MSQDVRLKRVMTAMVGTVEITVTVESGSIELFADETKGVARELHELAGVFENMKARERPEK